MAGIKKGAFANAKRSRQIHLEILLAFGIILASLILPYVNYLYKSTNYSLSGIGLLTGKVICGGTLKLGVSVPMVIVVLAALAILVAAFADYLKNENLAYGIATISAILVVVTQIYLSSSIAKTIGAAKNVRLAFGSVICLVAAIVLMIWGMYRLWRNKVLSSLDFMAIPGMMYFVINNYIPMLGIVIAFKKIDYSKGILDSPWVGFENFKQLFGTNASFFKSDAWRITRNTMAYNAVFIILGTVVGILVGMCLADIGSKLLQKFFQTSILLPQLLSYVIVAYIAYGFFSTDSGFINNAFGTNINFYAEQKYWPFVLVITYIWKMVGYNAIIFLSSIIGIDHSIYEAARVDGCNVWKQIRYITLPLLKPTVVTLFMLSVGRIMYSDFGLFYQVTRNSGALYEVTDTIDTYVYRCLMTLNNISTSSAASTYQAIIGFALVFIINMIVRRRDKENALF